MKWVSVLVAFTAVLASCTGTSDVNEVAATTTTTTGANLPTTTTTLPASSTTTSWTDWEVGDAPIFGMTVLESEAAVAVLYYTRGFVPLIETRDPLKVLDWTYRSLQAARSATPWGADDLDSIEITISNWESSGLAYDDSARMSFATHFGAWILAQDEDVKQYLSEVLWKWQETLGIEWED